MDEIKNFERALERLFNILGYIPLVSTLSGTLRIGVYSVVQGVLALIGLAGTLFLALLLKEQRERWLGGARFCAFQVLEGRLNAGRGLVEVVPIIGNILCYGYDKMMAGRTLAESKGSLPS